MDSENTCCIVGCANTSEQCTFGIRFYRFPSDDNPVSSIQRSMWVEAIQNSSLNGPTWLPSELSMICSEHFLEIKSVDDPSFLPGLFPAEVEDSISSELHATKKQVGKKDMSGDFGVLQKVVDKLPVLSADDLGRSGPAQGRADTSELKEAFRILALHVCRQLVAHDSELVIEGTVGVTVDGGARVMLLHFADQVRKTEAANTEQNVQNPLSEATAEGDMFHCGTKDDAQEENINKEEKITGTAVGNVDYSTKLPSFADNSSQYSSGSWKILSDLAQQTESIMHTNSGLQSDAMCSSTHKRKAEIDDCSIGDKPKQQTLLRELLCAPLPPKRPCRPVNITAPAATASIVGEVRPRQPLPNSSVLGGLLQSGTYQRASNYAPLGSIYGRDVHLKHEPETAMQGGYSPQHLGIDIHNQQFGGNAVRALLRLASEHTAAGRHDSLRNNRYQESAATKNDGFSNDGSTAASLDRRQFNVLYQNLVGSDVSSNSSRASTSSSEFASTGQNITRNDSSTTICSSSEPASLTVKEEVVDPGYD